MSDWLDHRSPEAGCYCETCLAVRDALLADIHVEDAECRCKPCWKAGWTDRRFWQIVAPLEGAGSE